MTLPNLRLFDSNLSFLAPYPDAWIHPSFWLDDNWSIFTRLRNFNESYRRKTWKIFQSICENERWTSFKLFIRFIFINHVPIWNFYWPKNFRNLSLLFGIYFGHSCADHFPRWNFRYSGPILPWTVVRRNLTQFLILGKVKQLEEEASIAIKIEELSKLPKKPQKPLYRKLSSEELAVQKRKSFVDMWVFQLETLPLKLFQWVIGRGKWW